MEGFEYRSAYAASAARGLAPVEYRHEAEPAVLRRLHDLRRDAMVAND